MVEVVAGEVAAEVVMEIIVVLVVEAVVVVGSWLSPRTMAVVEGDVEVAEVVVGELGNLTTRPSSSVVTLRSSHRI